MSASPDRRNSVKSDLLKLDAHDISPGEYEELPEWTEDMFMEADMYEDGKLIRRGSRIFLTVQIPLSRDVVARFSALGPGWEARIDAVLREWLADHAGSINERGS